MRRWAIIGTATVATAAAIFAVLSLSNGGGSPLGGSPLAEAGERIEGQSMRMKLDLIFVLPKEGTVKAVGTGIMAADGSTGSMRLKYTIKDLQFPMDLRTIGDEWWFHSDRFSSFMPRGKRWVHSVDKTTAPETLTPSEFAQFLANADEVDKVSDVAMVNGKPTAHYVGAVDALDIAEEVGGETEERLDRILQGRHALVPVEAWIGRDGMPARIRVNCGEQMTMTADILEYGVPVDVARPPAGATIEEAEFDKL
jgi:hypothetical protein